jgi:hypothetical protein
VLASTALSTTIATPLFTRFVRPRRQINLMGPLAVLTCGPMVLTVLHSGLLSAGDFSVGRVGVTRSRQHGLRSGRRTNGGPGSHASMGDRRPGVAFVAAYAAAEPLSASGPP